MKIIFFLESLYTGGKERRVIELFHYLKQKTNSEIQIVLTEDEIQYKYVLELGIPITILKRGLLKKDPLIFLKFFNIVKLFKPDIIHTWGAMTTLYAIPSSRIFGIPLINSQISNTFLKKYRSNFLNLIWNINHHFSSLIIANSIAGLKAYQVKSKKGIVILNGIRLERFRGLNEKYSVKEKYNIKTPFAVIMVANFSKYKDYGLFFEIAKKVCYLRDDVTFVAVGDGETRIDFINKVNKENLDRFLFTGKISNVEELANACDIGVLFSNISTGEGISNTIMEYMALSKPVIATDSGGTSELVSNNFSGFLINTDFDLITQRINTLLDNPSLRNQMGEKGRKIIENRFTIEKMGSDFVKEYDKIVKI